MDMDVTQQPREAKSRMGFVPDQPELYDKLTGREFLHFVGQLRGLRGKPLDECHRVDDSAVRSAIVRRSFDGELLPWHETASRVRRGSHPRSASCWYWTNRWSDWIPRACGSSRTCCVSERRDGNTVFLSTHTLAIAEEIAHRIGVIHRGQLLFVGTFHQLRQQMDRGDGSLEDLYLALTDDEDESVGCPGQPGSHVNYGPVQQ